MVKKSNSTSPLVIVVILLAVALAFSLIMNTANKSNDVMYKPVDGCNYTDTFNQAILNVEEHCVADIQSQDPKNIPFCDEFMNLSNIISLYNWDE